MRWNRDDVRRPVRRFGAEGLEARTALTTATLEAPTVGRIDPPQGVGENDIPG